jgi:hypothetical protein
MEKIVKKGFAGSMDGSTLWIDTENDERITIRLKDDRVRWDLYCKNVKVTIEVIDEKDRDTKKD